MNDYADHYSSIVQSILIGQTEQAHETVRCIPGGERGISKVPRNLPIPLQWQVFKRDHFVCRYCEKRTVLPPVLRLLSYFLGDDFRYHRHGLMTECHVAFWRDIASCDHIVPVPAAESPVLKTLPQHATCATRLSKTGYWTNYAGKLIQSRRARLLGMVWRERSEACCGWQRSL
jgi:hypothetical protein